MILYNQVLEGKLKNLLVNFTAETAINLLAYQKVINYD